jgi:hypothetical protein
MDGLDRCFRIPIDDGAERLLDSVTPSEAAGEETDLAEEAERRLRAYEAGEVQSIPAVDVFRDLLSAGAKPTGSLMG